MHERCETGNRGLAACTMLSLCLMLMGPATAADQAWTRDATSTGLQREGVPVAVVFAPRAGRPDRTAIPPGAVITAVYASRDYTGTAQVATDLCQDPGRGPCVSIAGRSTTTHAFDGLPASGPLWLVHRVVRWGPAHPPLFVRGTVTVWFTMPVRH